MGKRWREQNGGRQYFFLSSLQLFGIYENTNPSLISFLDTLNLFSLFFRRKLMFVSMEQGGGFTGDCGVSSALVNCPHGDGRQIPRKLLRN